MPADRDGDPLEHRRLDGGSAELLHQGVGSGHEAGPAGVLHVVGPERRPALAHRRAQAVEVERALSPQEVVGGLCGLGRKSCSATPDPGRRSEGHEAERVDRRECPRTRSPRSRQSVPRWRRRASGRRARGAPGRSSRSARRATPACARVESAVGHLGPAVAGQVGRATPVPARESRHHARPVRRVLARAVQQDHRRSPPPSRTDVDIPASARRRSATGILARSRSRVVVSGCRRHAADGTTHRGSRIGDSTQPVPAGWVVSPSQTSPCSYAYAVAAARRGTHSLAKMLLGVGPRSARSG